MGSIIRIPAREGRAAFVPAGGRFEVVEVTGKQCADLFVFSAADVSEYLSAEHTRVYNGRLFPKLGEPFVTNRRRPIVVMEEDHSPGTHDMLCAACDPARYELLGATSWHASCQENLLKAMAALGHRVEIPQPVNVFANYPIGPDGDVRLEETPAGPGDYVLFRAEMDSVVCVSSCPQDIVPVNALNPTDLELHIL